MEDWAEICRLHRAEQVPIKEIARRLRCSPARSGCGSGCCPSRILSPRLAIGLGIKAVHAGHPVLFDAHVANLFFQLISSRYEQGSVLATSNMPFSRWGEIFGDDVVAAAMIDRLVHHAEVLTLSGDSYRTRNRRELIAKDPATPN